MKYMLDTNICVYIMKHMPHVIGRFQAVFNEGVSISVISLAELEFGVANSAAIAKNRAALISFGTLVRTLPFDRYASAEYGKIRATLQKRGTPIGSLDMLIGAHAKSAGLTLVTNNTREFGRIDGLDIEDWV